MFGPIDRWFPADAARPAAAPADRVQHGDWEPVLARYPAPLRPLDARYLAGAGGFSGARLWRLRTHAADLCLRRWPQQHPSRERLAWIHSVLRYAAAHGFERLPIPLAATDGESWVEQDGCLWELSPWVPGRADFRDHPAPERLRRALTALAEFHRAVEGFTRGDSGPSRSLVERRQQIERLQQGMLSRLIPAVEQAPASAFRSTAQRVLGRLAPLMQVVGERLDQTIGWTVPLCPCWRDVWHDHVLFVGNEVSGLIDCGAMRVDSVAGDVARLLGSLVGDDGDGWRDGVSAYETVRPLSETERQLLPVFDQSGTLLSGVNWLDWIYLQGRQFDDPGALDERLIAILGRMDALSSRWKGGEFC